MHKFPDSHKTKIQKIFPHNNRSGIQVMLFLQPVMLSTDSLMHRCLQLAGYGSGKVAPNPLVGCVIESEGTIIGEGYHRQFGKEHAEVNAIASVKDTSAFAHSTLYVNLEPCSHFGKTPPCTDKIISCGIPKVVIGMEDPFALVKGSGIQKMRDAGIEVICNVLQTECMELNKRFICYHNRNRPYIILKWAQSIDGITGLPAKRIHISNKLSQIISHKWRSEESAILIGAGTAALDDPMLNTRHWQGVSPVRVILDRSGNLCGKNNLHVFNGHQRTLVYTQQENSLYPNAEVISFSDYSSFLPSVLAHLHQSGINSILVEGGSITHQLFIEQQLWDECRVFISNETLGSGIKAPGLPYGQTMWTPIGDNRLLEIKNPKSA